VDIVCRTQFIQLRRMGLFIRADIPEYNLVFEVCYQNYFAENTFQFLVEWYPSSLVHIDEDEDVPLHCAAHESTIQAFRTVFEYLIRYYPTKKGISSLFTKNNQDETAFQLACEEYGKDGVTRIVEDTLNNSVIPLTIVETVVMAAADENIHLDCSYFLLRREPDVLVRLLSAPHHNNNDDDDDGGGGEDDHDNDGDTADDKNDTDEDNGNEGDTVGNENHDEEDDDKDEEGDEDVGIEDSNNNGTGTRKRKRKGCSIDGG